MIDKATKELLLPQVVNAAIAAGAAIMQHYNACQNSDQTKHVIGAANQAAQNAIKEALGPTRIPILSEEGREMLFEERQNWEMFWLVDPLDGTREFINKTNEFTVNIALMYHGEPIASVIYVPYLKKLYFASEGLGAHLKCDIEPQSDPNLTLETILEACQQLPLATAPRQTQHIALSRSHTTPETLQHVEEIRKRNPDIKLVEQGSSYKFCMLAEGAVEYYIRTSETFEWDTAAGELILAEAGGKTHSTEREKLAYNKENLQNPWFICHSKFSQL
ncbi:MAG: 3'(2'),5'-bisphosphate nucleotidase CysQ [Rikenellaceae bacterium]